MRRRLAAIWSADAVGYSRLMSVDDAGTFAELRTRRELLRDQVAASGGRVVDAVGDNLLAEFPSAVDAVRCAIAAQGLLAARDSALPEPSRLPFRIGIHLGEVLVDGEALAGDAVNVAARLCALAEPGGVWISSAVRAQVQGKVERSFADRGEQRLKNIADPVHAFSVSVAASARPASSEPGLTSRPGIAVLPFENLSEDADQEYLGDGIAEDLLTRMARWQVPVVARQSSFAYRGRSIDVRQIGRELGVRYVVEGSIRRSGNRIRLSVQLIDAETGAHAWAQRFDRELGRPVRSAGRDHQRDRAGDGTRIASRRAGARAGAGSAERDAWDAFLRAQWHHNRHTPEDWEEARRLIHESVALDPRFPNTQAALAILEYTGLINGWTRDRERSLADGLAAAWAGIALDPNLRDAQTALGLVCFQAGDHPRARAAFERGVELEPGNSNALSSLGWFLTAVGDYDEAVERLEAALELDERMGRGRGDGYVVLAQARLGAARGLEALRCAEAAAQRRDDPETHTILSAVLGHLGRIDEAKRAIVHISGTRLRHVRARLVTQVQQPLLDRILDGLRAAGMPE